MTQGWSHETYPVYTHPPIQTNTTTHDPLAFAIERAALPLFGLMSFGCLLTAYVRDPLTNQLKLWIPRRSRTKRTMARCAGCNERRWNGPRWFSNGDHHTRVSRRGMLWQNLFTRTHSNPPASSHIPIVLQKVGSFPKCTTSLKSPYLQMVRYTLASIH